MSMAALLEGIDIPEGCSTLLIIYKDGTWVNAYTTEEGNAIEVSEPHGRLIDADALNYTLLYKENWMRGTGIEAPAVWRKDIDAAPTIIPASGENE